MCSIIVSRNETKFSELIDLNQSRGKFSYSYCRILDSSDVRNYELIKDWGLFDKTKISPAVIHIGHTQAPTGGLIYDKNRIHPAQKNNSLLYHNGILKSSYIKFLQTRYKTTESWDTALLLQRLEDIGFDALSEIDGSFACVYIRDGKILVFRNEIAPLFYEEKTGSISSIKFDSSFPLEPNIVFKYEFGNLTPLITFQTKNNPYDI
jgi:glutamine phosphoribosylpyrophosphate amidotransferase